MPLFRILPPLPLAAAIAVGLWTRGKNRELKEQVRQLESRLYRLEREREARK